ncbi:MAG: apolipoprotein N-acyltransferase [Actinomycetaceae bacterium]|nr:apolipoprotein N-acyltransferase [Actinomycetaceae bacterium]
MVRAIKDPSAWSRLALDVGAGFIAGCGVGAAFPNLGLWWLTIPAMALLLARIDQARPRRAALIAAVFGATFWLPHIHWATLATGSVAPWLALSTVQTLFVAAWGACAAATRRLQWTRSVAGGAAAMALTWVGFEQLRSHTPWSGFPWGNLAYPQVDSPLGHLAPIGGEVLVSFAVVFIAALCRRALDFSGGVAGLPVRRRAFIGLAAVGLFFAPALVPLPPFGDEDSLRVGAIQGNIELPGPATYAIEGKVTGNHAAVMRDLIQEEDNLDLIVWGEAALDRHPRQSDRVSSLMHSVINEGGVPTIVGYPEYFEDHRLNWVAPWYPHAGLDEGEKYGKQIPVPFGEFIPLRSIISVLATEAAQINLDLWPVDNVATMDLRLNDGRDLRVAIGICFEVGYEGLLAQGVSDGGRILIIPTNNYHFRDSAQSTQQGQILRFRSLEFARAGVQASTTGVSMLTMPNGQIVSMTEPMAAEYVVGELPLNSDLTLAARSGDIPWKLAIAAATALVAWAVISPRIPPRRIARSVGNSASD